MSKFFDAVSRFGPLVAAFIAGLGGTIGQLFPQTAPIVDAVRSALGLFGVQADADLVGFFSDLVASAFLLYGSLRKAIALVRERYFGEAA